MKLHFIWFNTCPMVRVQIERFLLENNLPCESENREQLDHFWFWHFPLYMCSNQSEVTWIRELITVTVCSLRPWQTRTHCCRHKCFPVCPRAQHFVSRKQKMFLILFRNILCPPQMFPNLRSMETQTFCVSRVCAPKIKENSRATMCPRCQGL